MEVSHHVGVLDWNTSSNFDQASQQEKRMKNTKISLMGRFRLRRVECHMDLIAQLKAADGSGREALSRRYRATLMDGRVVALKCRRCAPVHRCRHCSVFGPE